MLWFQLGLLINCTVDDRLHSNERVHLSKTAAEVILSLHQKNTLILLGCGKRVAITNIYKNHWQARRWPWCFKSATSAMYVYYYFLEMATLSRSAKIPRERLLLFKKRRHSSTNRHTRVNTPTVLSLVSEIVFKKIFKKKNHQRVTLKILKGYQTKGLSIISIQT